VLAAGMVADAAGAVVGVMPKGSLMQEKRRVWRRMAKAFVCTGSLGLVGAQPAFCPYLTLVLKAQTNTCPGHENFLRCSCGVPLKSKKNAAPWGP